jgi:hypothetical protein
MFIREFLKNPKNIQILTIEVKRNNSIKLDDPRLVEDCDKHSPQPLNKIELVSNKAN